MEEWDVYDARRNLTGRTVCRGKDILRPGEYHLSVDVWIVNDRNQILIQKRSPDKKMYPGKWAQSAGGAVVKGEDSFQGCIREIEEELGIIPDMWHTELAYSFIRHNNTIVDVYVVRQNLDLRETVLQEKEVDDVRWASFDDIKKLLCEDRFVPSVMEGLYGALQNNIVRQETDDSYID